jgi:hypothetical protein
MLLIDHRVNTAAQLARVPRGHGVEIDLREQGGGLCLAHDPHTGGEAFGDWLQGYAHALCIFNMKSDGLEDAVLEQARSKVGDCFFLDLAAPTLVRLARRGERRLAVRYSEFEPLEACLAFAGKADWAWVDCFTRLPFTAQSYQALKRHFKLCLVSPELQGHGREAIPAYRQQLKDLGVELDAVCTKYTDDWG